MTVLSLVDRVRKFCDARGVEVYLRQSSGIGDHAMGGFFDEAARRLEVAIQAPGWVEVLAHEFGHVQQWAEGAFVDRGTEEAYEQHEAWLSRSIEAPAAQVRQWFRAIQACERDAERRAVSILVEENAIAEIPFYVRAANTYVLAYEAARRLRKWPRRSGTNAALVALMPSTLVEDLGDLPPGSLRLYTQCAKATA